MRDRQREVQKSVIAPQEKKKKKVTAWGDRCAEE
jgi:hypothetical protein